MILNEEFKKNVAIPYFKDIYKDLVSQSDSKSKGFNKITLLNVSHASLIDICVVLATSGHHRRTTVCSSRSQGPGVRRLAWIRARLLQNLLLEPGDQAQADLWYVSVLKPSSKRSYDFDKDGLISKEDVRLVLSHMPIEQSLDVHADHEGKFTSAGGGR